MAQLFSRHSRVDISTFFSFHCISRYEMCPHAFIPFKPVNPKTRLSCMLSQEERESFARAMLADVISAVKDVNCSPVIIGTELLTVKISRSRSRMLISTRRSIRLCPRYPGNS